MPNTNSLSIFRLFHPVAKKEDWKVPWCLGVSGAVMPR